MLAKGNPKLLLFIAAVDVVIYLFSVIIVYGFINSLGVIAVALVIIGVTTFVGFYIFSDDMRMAIAASFILYYLVLLAELLTATKFREAVQAAEAYTTFTTMVTSIVLFYFGATAVERVTSVTQDQKTKREAIRAGSEGGGQNGRQEPPSMPSSDESSQTKTPPR